MHFEIEPHLNAPLPRCLQYQGLAVAKAEQWPCKAVSLNDFSWSKLIFRSKSERLARTLSKELISFNLKTRSLKGKDFPHENPLKNVRPELWRPIESVLSEREFNMDQQHGVNFLEVSEIQFWSDRRSDKHGDRERGEAVEASQGYAQTINYVHRVHMLHTHGLDKLANPTYLLITIYKYIFTYTYVMYLHYSSSLFIYEMFVSTRPFGWTFPSRWSGLSKPKHITMGFLKTLTQWVSGPQKSKPSKVSRRWRNGSQTAEVGPDGQAYHSHRTQKHHP